MDGKQTIEGMGGEGGGGGSRHPGPDGKMVSRDADKRGGTRMFFLVPTIFREEGYRYLVYCVHKLGAGSLITILRKTKQKLIFLSTY